MNFVVLVDHKMKLKESKKLEIPVSWDLKVTVTKIVVSVFGTLPKVLEKRLEKWELEIKGWIKTIQIIAYVKSTGIV